MIELSAVGMASAFAAGVVSFLSPCVLPLVPGYVSYIAGRSGDAPRTNDMSRYPALIPSIFFVLGFSSVFISLGAGASAMGQVLLQYRYEANLIGGSIIVVFGLFMMGLLKWSWLLRDLRAHPELRGGGPFSAYVLGLAFGFGWTPCIGPILGAILMLSALSMQVRDGVALLAVYSLGLGIPFLLSAVFLDPLLARYKTIKRVARPLYIGSGAIMVATGVAMLTGQLSAFSFWLLEVFPVLGTIG
jgi:cytochrome c-type biogenesis protein